MIKIYSSEYGWSMSLPENWQSVPGSGDSSTLTSCRPKVFESPSGQLLTWMIGVGRVDPQIQSDFQALLFLGNPLDLRQLLPLCNRIFPLIGQLDEAKVVELPDKTSGLELIETIAREGGENKRGYQLIVPLYYGPRRELAFQRLCFYAPEHDFHDTLDTVRDVARSFHYERPFDLKA